VKADASVYEGKRVIRRALARVPGLERLDPNVVTVAILVPAVLAGVSLWQSWWILAAVGAAGRMVLATLDGYIAERFERRTPLGAYLNRIVTEVADAIVLLGLLGQADALWVALAIASAWIVNVAGVLGPVAGGSIQWTGPAGQADRLAIVLGASLIAIVWPIDWTILCGLLVMLSVITAARRVSRSIRELRG
jgi:phosphatidylglycerophosphate synthase